MFLCHTDSTDFTDIFRITKKARLRAFFIEPCSHCQPDARSASKAGRRKARRDNHTNEGAQTWLYHTDNTDFTDIFSNHAKGEVTSLYEEIKFQTEFISTTTTITQLPRATG